MTQSQPNSAAAQPKTAVAPPRPRQDNQTSVKETLESILVAFILAFIFRAFVVEAFVIPTGSMAPTLLGANTRFRCNDCGYRFTVNYSSPPSRDNDIIIRDTADVPNVTCPNCGYTFPTIDPAAPDNAKTNHPVHYGDRILVLKYLYLLHEPQRWDVVVFKSPDHEADGSPPTYTQNYIKRLIGTPGESIMILDGDVYVGKDGDPPTSYRIQTKPRCAQEAMWRIVNNNDFFPFGVERPDGKVWKQPWSVEGGSGWNLGAGPADGRVFHFNNATDQSTIAFNKDANPNTNAFTDWMAYDVERAWRYNVIHDLKINFFYQRQSGGGEMRATLGDGRRKFAAVLTPQRAQLVEVTDAGDKPIGDAIALKPGSEPVHVELTNVDYRVNLRIDDKDIAHTTAEQFHPDMQALLTAYDNEMKDGYKKPLWPSAEISAAKQSAAISHLSLWRDVYYINNQAGLRATPHRITHLGDDEYFVMGDNSPVSADARYWDIPIDLPADRLHVQAGRVPGRFMLGRAFFVYWPAGFAPVSSMPSLAPNFGEMRFIR